MSERRSLSRERERVLFLASERERVRHYEERANALVILRKIPRGKDMSNNNEATVRSSNTQYRQKKKIKEKISI